MIYFTNKSRLLVVCIGILLLAIQACKITQYEHKRLDNDFTAGKEKPIECEQLQLAYTEHVEPLVESKCIKCHEANGGAGNVFALAEGETQKNINTLTSLFAGNYIEVINKTTGKTSHVGGALLGRKEAATMEHFLSSYQACND
ncbi:hypothetical protein [Pseudobacteriovorax antillogorgiicola]|uniref:Uncharacterized protein n=1 Tax=Pseudobacteriovorax antillogorgiicola TaxID=1513793 RepID=A0A1Y6CIK3_9BACT|nr:hypothetical protein [Pseudobacteriovorax antillogorgiicola]TCS46345.1 hypothetical protein EDD56_1249 [Pseudobacteriovorax antillogorgiicola]SMF68076.1 hypothetical protein SAMN06296036_1249 [Pseudobacteriovorax antillogorgiicola]